MLSRDSEDEMWSRFVFELAIWPQEVTLARWTQPSGPLCLWQCLYNGGICRLTSLGGTKTNHFSMIKWLTKHNIRTHVYFTVSFHWGGISATAQRDLNCQLGKSFKKNCQRHKRPKGPPLLFMSTESKHKDLGNRHPLLLSASIMWLKL